MFGAFIHELCDAIMHKLNPPIEPSYLAPFPRYSLRWVQNRYILLPLLCLTPTSEGFPWDDHCEIFSGCQPMAKVPNAVEILRKIWTAWVGRTSVTDDRQTDGRQQIANVNVSSRSLKAVSGEVLPQSIAFRVVSIYWQGVALFPWYLNAERLTPIGSTCTAHTSPHSAAAVRDIKKSLTTANMQSKTLSK